MDKYYLDYRKALEDNEIDAAVIVTPTAYHREIAIASAGAGKHILCEKPMAMDENECDDMMHHVEKNGYSEQKAVSSWGRYMYCTIKAIYVWKSLRSRQ